MNARRTCLAWLAAMLGSGAWTWTTNGESEPVGNIGPAACTPDSVRVLACLALRGERDPQARMAVETLGRWGPRAAQAIPNLLRGLRAQTAAGGMSMHSASPPPPDFARALSVIGVDHREVLVELLAVPHRGHALTSVRRWMEGSKEGETLLAEVFVPLLLPLTFDVRAPYNFGYSNEDALDFGEVPLAFQAWGALMNVTQDPAPYEAALRHPDWLVRNASASLYSRQGELSTNVVRELGRCLQDAHPWVRLAAAVPLARVVGYERAVLSNLLAAIPDRELPGPLRKAAISLIGHPRLEAEKVSETTRVLGVALEDPDPRVRDAAQRYLDRMQSKH